MISNAKVLRFIIALGVALASLQSVCNAGSVRKPTTARPASTGAPGEQSNQSIDRLRSLENFLRSFETIQLDVPALLDNAFNGTVSMNIGSVQLNMIVENSNLWDGPMPTFIDDGSGLVPVTVAEPFLFKGTVVGKEGSDLRLSINSDTSYVSGYIRFEDEWFIIEPMNTGTRSQRNSTHYLYRSTDVIPSGGFCGTEVNPILKLPDISRISSEKLVFIAKFIAYGDFEFFDLNRNNWSDRQAAVLNDVAGIYSAQIEVNFNITGFIVRNAPGSPFHHTDPSALLAAVRDRFRDASSTTRQFVHMFTGKDLDGNTLGIAYIFTDALGHAIGRCRGYSLAQQVRNFLGIPYEASAYEKMILSAHEIGHNFTATHNDAEVEGSFNPLCLFKKYTIMSTPLVGGCMTDHFSTANVSHMEAFDNIFADITVPDAIVSINSGQAYTKTRQVSVSFTVTDLQSGVALIGLRNSSVSPYGFLSCFSGGSSTGTWSLTSGDGQKKVVLVAYDKTDNKRLVNDDIVLDQTKPSSVANVRSPSHVTGQCSTDRTVEMCWDAAFDATSGIDGYSILWSMSASAVPDCVKDIQAFGQCDISSPLSNGLWYFTIRAIDKAGWCGAVNGIGPFIIDDPPTRPLITGLPSTVCGGKTYSLKANSSNADDFSWTSFCGGPFSDRFASETDWTAPINFSGSCRINVDVSNACDVDSDAASTTVNQKPGPINQDSSGCFPQENGPGRELYWNPVPGTEFYLVFRDAEIWDTSFDTTSFTGSDAVDHDYLVQTVNSCGRSEKLFICLTTDVENEVASVLPKEFRLNQNYPNPFNPSTKIEFALPQKSFVTLEIYNVQGRKIATLMNRELPAGYNTVTWDGKNEAGAQVSSGIYFYRLVAGEIVQSRKMVLLK